MKKLSILIFTIITLLLTPVFFANATVLPVTINTYDLTANSVGLEFHNLASNTDFSIFVKNNTDAGNKNTHLDASTLVASKVGKDGYATYIFDNLEPNLAYIGAINVPLANGGTDLLTVKFITPVTSLDFTTYHTTLATANSLYSSSVEGTAVGNYTVGSKAILKAAIDENTLTDAQIAGITTQAEVDGYTTILQTSITTFGTKVVPGTITDSSSSSSTKTGFFGTAGGLIPACPANAPCGFDELMKLINNVIAFLLFTIATPLAALVIVYAGWLYLSAGGSVENATKAKKILLNVVIGYVIALAAWIIVKTILLSLGFNGPMYLS